jgi:hypothetical protein
MFVDLALTVRARWRFTALCGLILVLPVVATAQDEEVLPRTHFVIEPGTPLAKLLPVAPKWKKPTPQRSEDLRRVPEIDFEQPLVPFKTWEDRNRVVESLALTRSRIEHLNQKHPDAFMTALLKRRRDLAGLPVMFGDECRLGTAQAERFQGQLGVVRQALTTPINDGFGGFGTLLTNSAGQMRAATAAEAATQFWKQYAKALDAHDEDTDTNGQPCDQRIVAARIAVLMQVLGAEPEPMRLGLARHLAGILHVDATKALAKLAVFSEEESVRLAAIDGLKQRRGRDYDDVLRRALRYPHPPVALRAGEALVRLERADWAPQLVRLLDEPDPRAPVIAEGASAQQPVVRELVRINHHRNCFLCHAPGAEDVNNVSALIAPVPIPGEPLPSFAYYGSNPGEILVRFDVTYVRQDFSVMQCVADHGSWPEMQRFDFVVRERKVTDAEADALRESLTIREPGALSPYHRAAVAALRGLTRRDAAPNAEAWRQLLGIAP